MRNWTLLDVPRCKGKLCGTMNHNIIAKANSRHEKRTDEHPAQFSIKQVHADAKLDQISPQVVDGLPYTFCRLSIRAHNGHGGRVFKHAVLDCQAAVVDDASQGHADRDSEPNVQA